MVVDGRDEGRYVWFRVAVNGVRGNLSCKTSVGAVYRELRKDATNTAK